MGPDAHLEQCWACMRRQRIAAVWRPEWIDYRGQQEEDSLFGILGECVYSLDDLCWRFDVGTATADCS